MRRSRSLDALKPGRPAHDFVRIDGLRGPHETALLNPATGHFAFYHNVATFGEEWHALTFCSQHPPPSGFRWLLVDHGPDWRTDALKARLRPIAPNQVSIDALLRELVAGATHELLIAPGGDRELGDSELGDSKLGERRISSLATFKRLAPFLRRPCRKPTRVSSVDSMRQYAAILGQAGRWYIVPTLFTRGLDLQTNDAHRGLLRRRHSQ